MRPLPGELEIEPVQDLEVLDVEVEDDAAATDPPHARGRDHEARDVEAHAHPLRHALAQRHRAQVQTACGWLHV